MGADVHVRGHQPCWRRLLMLVESSLGDPGEGVRALRLSWRREGGQETVP